MQRMHRMQTAEMFSHNSQYLQMGAICEPPRVLRTLLTSSIEHQRDRQIPSQGTTHTGPFVSA